MVGQVGHGISFGRRRCGSLLKLGGDDELGEWSMRSEYCDLNRVVSSGYSRLLYRHITTPRAKKKINFHSLFIAILHIQSPALPQSSRSPA
jgi:hypothetical protein